MIYGFFALVVAMFCGAILISRFIDKYDGLSFIAVLSGSLLCLCAGVGGLIYAGVAYGWIAADTKAQIINREYGTNYTQAEVFYADDVIETIRQIKRHRVEATIHVDGGKE